MKNLLTIIFLAMITTLSIAQDPQFSQFFAAPLYLNPALAGTDSAARLGFNFRNDLHTIAGQFITYDLAYDQYVNALHGGIGIMAWKDNAGSGTYSTTNFSGIYSFQQHIYKELNISIGIQGAYMQENLNWSELNFGYPINAQFVYPTQEIAPKGEGQFFDLSAGITGFTKEFYGGISFAHITQPIQNFHESVNQYLIIFNTRLPVKFTGNFGAMIPLNNSPDNTAYISPNIIYIQQEGYYQINFGLYAQSGCLVGGLWYRGGDAVGDAVVATVGFQKWGLRIGYSYDIPVNQQTALSGGANELSLGYIFHSRQKNHGINSIITPSF